MGIQTRKKQDAITSTYNGAKVTKRFNQSTVYGWQYKNQLAYDIIKQFTDRINNGDWLSAEDRATYKTAIDDYISSGTSLRNVNKHYGGTYTAEEEKGWLDSLSSLNRGYADIDKFYGQFKDDREYGNWQKYHKPIEDTQYNQYVESGRGVSNPTWNEAHAPFAIGNWTPFGDGKSVNNMVTFAESNSGQAGTAAALSLQYGDSGSPYTQTVNLINAYMTDEEKDRYNYYIGKGDTKAAQEYLDYMTDILNSRAGEKISGQVNNTFWELPLSALSGMKSGAQGIENFVKGYLGNGEIARNTALQYAQGQMSQDNSGIWKAFNDSATSIGNMMPAIGVGTLATMLAGPAAGKAVGSVVTGISSAGNSYAQMIREGYGEEQAKWYGAAVGAAEGGISYLIGGIGSIGGKLTGNVVSKVVDGIDNGIARFFAETAINGISEGFEEGIQAILEPKIKQLVTGEHQDINWSDVGYSAMLGAMTAGLIEGIRNGINMASSAYSANVAHGGLSISDAIKAIYDRNTKLTDAFKQGQLSVNEAAGNYANMALELDPNNKYAQRMQNRINEGKNVSGYQINQFGEEIQKAAITHDTGKIKSAVENRLTELGETENVSALADALTKKTIGEKLSSKESNLIKNSKFGERISNELNRDNIQSGEYSTAWAEGIGTKVLNADVYNLRESTPTQATQTSQEAQRSSVGQVDNVKAVESIAKNNTQGYNEETVSAMVKGYDGTLTPSAYESAFNKAYNLGKNNESTNGLKNIINSGVSEQVAFTAYELGKNSVLQTQAKSGIINTEQSSEVTNEGENIHLRNGGEWNGSANSQGQISTVEGSAGQNQSWGETRRFADSEAARLVNEGREVSVADLGILGGAKNYKVRLLDGVEETTQMKEGRKYAESRALKVKYFAGNNLFIYDKSGQLIEANGYISNGYVFVRADHDKFTSNQIMRHEVGHDMIAKGEVNINQVRQKIKETFKTDKEVDQIAEYYATAYAMSTSTAEDVEAIWEEVICDSLADMNVFSGSKTWAEAAEHMGMTIPAVQKAVSEGKANQTRGSPEAEGKASRDINEDVYKGINAGEDTKDGTKQENTSGFLRRNINDTRIGITEVSKESGRIVSIGNKSGLFKGASKGGILSYDSEGRAISQELLNKLKNTAIKDSAGHLIAVYHATSTTFEKFTIGDIGFHFGNKIQADNRAKYKNIKNPKYIGAYLNIEKPLIIEKDYMNWHANSAALNLWNDGIINDFEKDAIVSLWSKGKEYNSPAAIKLREILVDKGYDGIAYANQHEGDGYSFIAFNDSQIVRFDEGKTSRELDTAYLDAVKSGDMETAQKMVDEAAKKAGYDYHLYHGTDADFTKFDLRKHGGQNGKGEGYGIYLASNREIAAPYGKNVINSYTKFNRLAEGRKKTLSSTEVKNLIKRSCELEAKQMVDDGEYDSISEALKDTWVSNVVYTYDYSSMEQVYNDVSKKLWSENDNDGDLINEIMALSGAHYDYNNALKFYENILTPITGIDGFHYIWGNKDSSGVQNDIYLAFNSEQIKSADPVTYDDDGNVVPLSERFNPDNVDIRFSRELELEDYDAENEVKPISNRELLVNSLETTAQNEAEKEKLAEYKGRIDMLNAEEKKLAQLKSELKELTFGNGAKDPAKIKALREEIVKTENRINLHDKKLLQLESTKSLKDVLEREKSRAYKRAAEKGREALYRNVEGRNKTAERHLIVDVVNELDKLLNKGTKKKNVKIGQQDVISKVLDVTNMLFATDDELILNGIKTEVTSAEQTAIDKYMRLYNEYHEYDDSVTEHKEERKAIRHEMDEIKKQFSDVLERERQRISNLKASSAFDALIEEYEKLANSDKTYIRDTFDADTLQMLKQLKEDVGDTTVSNMTLEQLKTIRKALTMMKKMVQNTNKLFASKGDETIEALGSKAQSEVEAHGHKDKFNVFEKAYAKYDWNNLKPIYLFERTGSSVLQKLGNAIFHGESVWAVDMEEARAFHYEQKLKYNFNDWDLDKTYTFTNATGQTYTLSLEQIMSVYAYSKRGKQALDHLKMDGFVFDAATEIKEKGKLIKYELNDKTAYKITDEVLVEMVGKLSTEQKSYVDVMQKYLSEVMGEKGNEVSRELYGIDLFGEENYFPIRSEGAYLERVRQQAKGEVKIKNKGFTKETQKNARNAIVLSDFSKVWSEHVAEMSSYHAFTLPLEDFYRVYNYQTTSDEKVNKRGVIPALENAYGAASTSAIDQLLSDINGGARTDARESYAADMLRKFKIGKTMASLSVVVQQPSSIARAQAMIDTKYFIGGKIGDTKRGELWGELKKYAPVAIIKEMGYFDVGMGRSSADWLTATEYDGVGEKVKGFFTDADYRSDVLSTPAAKADELTWVTIWNAVKRETASKNPTLNTSSEQFLKLAGARFEDVIRHTQVYDSTLSRSSNMRSKSLFMQMATAFMAEPTTAINMREMAARSGDKKRILRTTAAVYSAVLLNSLLVALPYAMRDDDEDETFLEKYTTSFSDSLISGINPVTSLPFIKDIWSIFQGYDIERADMSLASDLIESLKKLAKAIDKKDGYGDAIVSILGDLSAFTGIPLDNIIRDAKSVINAGKTFMADKERDTTWNSISDQLEEVLKSNTPVWGWFPSENKGEKLYDALVSNDTKYVARFRSTYKTEDDYQSAVRKSLRDNDPRMREAAQAYLDGNYSVYNALRDEISKEGIFDYKLITDALKAEINYLKRKAEEAEE